MTERTNPLINRAFASSALPPFVTVDGQQVPTDIVSYCAWLNSREHRGGSWIVAEDKDAHGNVTNRRLEWRELTGSLDWMREKGLLPKIGRAE